MLHPEAHGKGLGRQSHSMPVQHLVQRAGRVSHLGEIGRCRDVRYCDQQGLTAMATQLHMEHVRSCMVADVVDAMAIRPS